MPSRSELAEKTKKDLKGEARRIGVSDDAIDDAGEADDEKAALIDLIVDWTRTQPHNARNRLERLVTKGLCLNMTE